MSNFPLIRHRDFKTWIPDTDIDATDAKESVLTTVLNADFKNGYIEAAKPAVVQANPALVATDISNGYDLLSIKGFHHSEQGDKTIYVLWKESTKDLKLYVNGDILLNLDEQNSDITFIDKPNNINYNLVNDQLKINLNCLATYGSIDEGSDDILLNLTLVYLETTRYNSSFNTLTRQAAWYCFPRWLGWNYELSGITGVEGINSVVGFETNFIGGLNNGESMSFTSNVARHHHILPNPPSYKGEWSVRIQPVSAEEAGSLSISGMNSPSEITFYYWSGAADVHTVEIRESNGTLIESFTLSTEWRWSRFNYEFKQFYSNAQIIINAPSGGGIGILVDDINIEYNFDRGWALVALYEDGQRGLIDNNEDSDESLNEDSTLRIYKSDIDWRVVKYELYIKVDNIFILAFEQNITNLWVHAATYFEVAIVLEETTRTLNYNYNLPADERVDNQRNILQEVSHKGRVYFVNENFRVYQSHILPNLAIQADSFPYDEDVGFGYFIVDHSRKNIGLGVTPTNYLAVFTDNGYYVYFIQPSASGSFKILRMVSGSIGLSSRNSVARSLTGDPASDGLFWIDYNGVYFHTGDSQPPRNLIVGTHENFWRDISNLDKDGAVGFYNPLKREYWLRVGETLMAFELPYNKWKTYAFTWSPDEFYGIFNNNLYWRSGNTFVKYDITVEDYSSFSLTSPYNIGNTSEIYDKILQEIYVVLGDSQADTLYMLVTIDDRSLITYEFNTANRYEVWLAPLGVRFNRIRFHLYTLTGGKKIRIKEFGCSYTDDSKEALGNTAIERDVETGYGFDYGSNYGGGI